MFTVFIGSDHAEYLVLFLLFVPLRAGSPVQRRLQYHLIAAFFHKCGIVRGFKIPMDRVRNIRIDMNLLGTGIDGNRLSRHHVGRSL